MNDLKEKLKRKQKQIDDQIELLDEYRHTINFQDLKIIRLEKIIKSYERKKDKSSI